MSDSQVLGALLVLALLAVALLVGLLLRAQRRSQGLEMRAALAEQRLADSLANTGERTEERERTKQEFIQAAKAGALESARELSGKLIEDHKRESDEVKKHAEKKTKALNEQVEKLAGTVATLHQQTAESRRTAELAYKALSSPGGAGQFAEIGLENLLKQFGLQPGRDFNMQHTVADTATGATLRPDAVIFMPGNSVLVIDAKASKHLLDLAAADDAEGEEAAYGNLARTMNEHLKGLAAKGYRDAVAAAWTQAENSGRLGHVISVMYLPSDSAVEKLLKADGGFAAKAQKANIIVVGPAGLTALVAVTRLVINAERQAENEEEIIEQTRSLLESTVDVIGHVDKVGRGIRQAAENFAKLGGSINKRLLPRARRLLELGISPARNKTLPGKLPTYRVDAIDDFIEGEAEEVRGPAEITDLHPERTAKSD